MENRYEPEKQELQLQQEWKHYLPQEETPAANIIEEKELLEEQTVYPATQTPQASLCLRVRERLQSLLEEDYEMRPEMAAALYGHLALCHDCAFEFEEMQRVVRLLKTIPMADLPMDYSKVIMQRIMAQEEGKTEETSPHPTRAASSLVSSVIFEEVAEPSPLVHAQRNETLSLKKRSLFQKETVQAQKKIIVSVAVSGMFVFLLATKWGRDFAEVGFTTFRHWITQFMSGPRPAPALQMILDSFPA